MLSWFSRWRARHILAAWGAYWAGLAAVTLYPAATAIRQVAGPGEHGSSSLSFGDGGFHLSVLKDGATTWSGSVSLLAFTLMVAGPPLALWLAWLVRPKPLPTPDTLGPGARESALAGSAAPFALGAPPNEEPALRAREKLGVERRRDRPLGPEA